MARIESSEESESRSEGSVRYESDETVESSDTNSGTDSEVSAHGAGEGKGKGIAVGEGASAVKGKGKASKKGGRGSTGRQLQSVPIGGYPSRATVQRLNNMNFPRGVEWRVPLTTERAWAPPAGFMCLYESYFDRAHLFFPLPRAIIEFCARKRIAISQLGTVTMIDLLGLIVFGAEVGVTVDASFLERRVRLIANTKSAGTFQTQVGVVKGKPGKINGWNWNYFFVKINEASVGGAGSSIINGWNRVLGGKGNEDCCVKDKGEPYLSNLRRIERISDREFARFTQDRVDRQKPRICEQSGYVVSGSSVGRDEGCSSSAGEPKAVADEVKGNVKGGTQVIEIDGDREGSNSDHAPLVNKRAKVDAARKEKAKVGEPELAGGAAEASKKNREAALATVELGVKKRKEKEEKKRGRDAEVVGEGDGRGSGSSIPVFKKPRTGGSLAIPGSMSTMSKREGKKVQTGEKRSHRFKFDYQGETPVMMDPRICGNFLQQIPEALDEYVSGDVDLDATYDEFAGLIFQLVNVKNRFVRGHESVVTELKKEVTAREGEAARLKEDNDALKTLEKDVEEERNRRVSKEEELMAQVVEVGAKEAEIGRLNLELEKRAREIERLRQESLTAENLRKKVSSLEVALAGRDEEIVVVDRGCRAVLKRLLREQADAFYAGYLEKNEDACHRLDRYLSERERREGVESKLDQAAGTREVLKALKKGKIVEVPDATLLELKKKKKEYREELGKLKVSEFSSEDLRLGLPDSVGAVNIDEIDFKAELVVATDADGEGRARRGEEVDSQLVEEQSTFKDGDFVDVEN